MCNNNRSWLEGSKNNHRVIASKSIRVGYGWREKNSCHQVGAHKNKGRYYSWIIFLPTFTSCCFLVLGTTSNSIAASVFCHYSINMPWLLLRLHSSPFLIIEFLRLTPTSIAPRVLFIGLLYLGLLTIYQLLSLHGQEKL